MAGFAPSTPLGRRPGTLRTLVYRVCFRIACTSGSGAVHLAGAFRGLRRYGVLAVLAQLPVALLWVAARGLFIVSSTPCFAIARSGYPR